MVVKMIADRRFDYAGKVIEAGAAVIVENEGHAALLTFGGFAHKAEHESESDKRSYRRRDMKAEH